MYFITFLAMFTIAMQAQNDFPTNQTVLEKLGNGVDGTPVGLVVTSPNSLTFDDDLMAEYKIAFRNPEQLRQLLERAKRPDSFLAVYTLLNQLFPDEGLRLIEGPLFFGRSIELSEVRIAVQPSDKAPVVVVRVETFGAIVRDYWARKLKLE